MPNSLFVGNLRASEAESDAPKREPHPQGYGYALARAPGKKQSDFRPINFPGEVLAFAPYPQITFYNEI